MKFARAAAIVGLLLSAGCATRGNFESNLQTWVGSDVNALIDGWGPPSATFDLPDGRKMYTWDNQQGALAIPVGNSAVAVPLGCAITFTVTKESRVESWRYKGNNCY